MLELQFGGQEPGPVEAVQKFACARGGKFPVFAKVDVNGPATHPVFKFLKENAPRYRIEKQS